jgi:hypothetical protein
MREFQDRWCWKLVRWEATAESCELRGGETRREEARRQTAIGRSYDHRVLFVVKLRPHLGDGFVQRQAWATEPSGNLMQTGMQCIKRERVCCSSHAAHHVAPQQNKSSTGHPRYRTDRSRYRCANRIPMPVFVVIVPRIVLQWCACWVH